MEPNSDEEAYLRRVGKTLEIVGRNFTNFIAAQRVIDSEILERIETAVKPTIEYLHERGLWECGRGCPRDFCPVPVVSYEKAVIAIRLACPRCGGVVVLETHLSTTAS